MKMFRRIVSATLAFSLVLPFFIECKNASNIVAAVDTSVMYGDVNGDKKISILDLIKLKAYITENNTSEVNIKAADVDDDGKISAKDAVEVAMYLLNQTGSFSYEMNIDSDKDGLSDYIEKEILGTYYLDENEDWDTDKDGISDYDEVYICGTDPKKNDTGNTGVLDSFKDDDNDGLNNLDEINNGTSPKLADTDNDGLSDYDEVYGSGKYKYKSEPLKVDSDNDGISDYGEIQLGLNPKSNKSDGVTMDSEKVISQSISANDKKLSQINTSDNPYELSVSADTQGFIEEMLDIKVSDYSAFLMEDEIYGSIVDIESYEGYSISKLNLNFKLKNVSDPKDYIIFRYSDADGILLPTNTQYNGSNLYVSDCDPGTYCIVNVADMAKYYEDENIDKVSLNLNAAKSSQSTINVLYKIPVLKDCTVKSWSQIENTMKNVAQKLENTDKPFVFTLVFIAFERYYVSISCSSSDKLQKICKTATDFFDDLSIQSLSDASNVYAENVKQNNDIWKELLVSTSFSDNSYYKNGSTIISFNGVGTTVVGKSLTVSSGGLYSSVSSDNISRYTKTYYNALLKYGNSTLTDKFYQLLMYEDSVTSKYPCRISLFGRKLLNSIITSGSTIDSDGDGKSDVSEIIGTYPLSKLIKSSADASAFISRINLKTGGSFTADDIKVTTVKSDPTRVDGDEDGIPDSEDKYPRKTDYKKIDDKLLDDSKIFDEGYSKTVNKTLSEGATLNSNTGDKPNPYVDYRNSKYAKDRNSYPSRYEITPVSNSDYRITVDTALNDNCDVYVYEKGFLYNDTEIKSTITDDNKKYIKDESGNVKHNNYQYILEAGKTYHIVVIVCSLDNRREWYDVKVEQDNWVYAPNGGISFSEKIYIADENIIFPLSNYLKLYLPEHILSEKLKVLNFDEKYDPDFNDMFVFAMEKRMFAEKSKLEKIEQSVSNFVGIGSTYAGFVLLLIAPEAELAGIIITDLGTVATSVNLISSIEIKKNNFKESLINSTKDYNYNLCLTRYDIINTTLEWNTWSIPPYIHKYNEDKKRYSLTQPLEIQNLDDYGVKK